MTTSNQVATSLSVVDVVIDATGSVEMGALGTLDAINRKKHVVMMSVECDGAGSGPSRHAWSTRNG